jgi:hypothetical protein
MTSEITHTEEISDNDLYIVKSREVNIIFSDLSDVQKIEIQQRFDKAIVIAMKAQDLTAKIQFEKEVDEKQSEIQSKFEMVFLFFAVLFFVTKYSTNGLLVNFDSNWGYVVLLPLIVSFLYRYERHQTNKKINNYNTELKNLNWCWKELVPNYRLNEFVEYRIKNKLDTDERGTFNLHTVALKRSIVNVVGFKYDFA